MVCVHCSQQTRVINSRLQKRSNQIWRRRKCLGCGAVFSTEEAVRHATTWAVRGISGSFQPFERDKLFLSLYRSCQHRQNALEDAAALTITVTKKLLGHTKNGALDSQMIAQYSQVALNRFDRVASTHYRAFHQQ
jgi:transcriptional repressor NrdR